MTMRCNDRAATPAERMRTIRGPLPQNARREMTRDAREALGRGERSSLTSTTVQNRDASVNDPARQAEIGLCVLLAAADGDVSEHEIHALSSRLGSIVGDDYPAIVLGMIVESEISKMGELGPDRYVKTLVDRLPHARRMAALRGALVVACADGLAPEEERMFHDVAIELGIEAAAADAMLAEVRDAS
jgi:tellurite resistance protein